MLDDGDVIDLKKCETIEILLWDSGRVRINLSHGDGRFNNNIIISGDEDWVTNTFDKLNNKIESITPQNFWILSYKNITINIGAIIIGYSLSIFSELFIESIKDPSPFLILLREFIKKYSIITLPLVFWIQGIFPAIFIHGWLSSLAPDVEFDFGPEHKKIEKSRRKRLTLIILIVMLPIIINLITNYLG